MECGTKPLQRISDVYGRDRDGVYGAVRCQ